MLLSVEQPAPVITHSDDEPAMSEWSAETSAADGGRDTGATHRDFGEVDVKCVRIGPSSRWWCFLPGLGLSNAFIIECVAMRLPALPASDTGGDDDEVDAPSSLERFIMHSRRIILGYDY